MLFAAEMDRPNENLRRIRIRNRLDARCVLYRVVNVGHTQYIPQVFRPNLPLVGPRLSSWLYMVISMYCTIARQYSTSYQRDY